MLGWLILILIFGGTALYLFILIRNFQAKERASNERLNTHLALLNGGNNGGKATKKTLSSVNIRKLWGHPPPKKTVIKNVLHDENVASGWDYTVHLHPATEQYLGTDLFFSLKTRIADIPGVDDCIQQEPQIFLITTSSYDIHILTELFWREFLHLAEIAHLHKNNST